MARVKIDTLEMDAVPSQDHVGAAQVTEHPIEQGADPADHVRQMPDVLRLDCLVTNTPIGREPIGDNDARAAYEDLRRIKESGKLISVTTWLRSYENMVITDLSAPRDARTGDAQRFTIALKQIRLVSNRTLEVPTQDRRGKGKTKRGKQTAKPVEEPMSSTLFDIKEGVKEKVKQLFGN